MRASATTLAPEMSGAETAAIVRLLKSNRLKEKHLEIGTAAGGTLREMMLCYDDGSRPEFVVVDPLRYFPNQDEIVRRNLTAAGLSPVKVDMRVMRSTEAFAESSAKGERFSFIVIDAVHRSQHVMEDLRWTRMLEVGGFVCLHDFKKTFPGVKWSVRRFLKKNENYRLIEHVYSLAILQKTASSASLEVDAADLEIAEKLMPLFNLQRALRLRTRDPRNALRWVRRRWSALRS